MTPFSYYVKYNNIYPQKKCIDQRLKKMLNKHFKDSEVNKTMIQN